MKRLIAKFTRLKEKFASSKGLFNRYLHYWRKKGKLKTYQTASQMIETAEEHIASISSIVERDSTAVSKAEYATIKSKTKELKKIYKNLREITKPAWRQLVETVVIALTLAFFIRTFVFGLYHVPTGSAEPNILVGDRIWGNKFHYMFNDFKRGDLVIFDRPGFVYDKSNYLKYFWQKYIAFPVPFAGLDNVPDNWVKRIIALPGDKIEGRVVNGKTEVYLNDEKLDEPMLNPYPLIHIRKTTGFFKSSHFGPIPIPGFLRQSTKHLIYTYVPEKSLPDQPYYAMSLDEIVRDRSGRYQLELPGTPCFKPNGKTYDEFGPFIVPQGKLWVQGDSRKNSGDSRYWGFLDQKIVHGRASFVIFSIDSEEPFWLFAFLKNPIQFWTRHVRWNRFLNFLK